MENFWLSVSRIGISVLIGLGCMLILRLSLRGVENRIKRSPTQDEQTKRLKTLVNAGRNIGYIVILLVFLLILLNELGVNITPILASTGLAGLALSLGAQTIIKDFLAGIIILTENQFTIGDIISVDGTTGTVERMTLRATYLRDSEGKLTLIPNGDIRSLSNLTTQWAQVLLTFNFDYETDMQAVLHALEKAIQTVQSQEEVSPEILESPKPLGWTGFTDWAVQAQILAKTSPGKQWLVARALRKASLDELHKVGIRVAVPRQRFENV